MGRFEDRTEEIIGGYPKGHRKVVRYMLSHRNGLRHAWATYDDDAGLWHVAENGRHLFDVGDMSDFLRPNGIDGFTVAGAGGPSMVGGNR